MNATAVTPWPVQHVEPPGTRASQRRRSVIATRRLSPMAGRSTRFWSILFLVSERRPPAQVVLDLDATDDAVHGNQDGRFFHGYYGHYYYVPLYITCGEHVLCFRLRHADADAADGAVDDVAQIRQRWPDTKIIVRGGSGFCREQIMAWCERQGVDYVLGLADNARLQPCHRRQPGRRRRSVSPRRCASRGDATRRPGRRRDGFGSSSTGRSTRGAATAGWWPRPSDGQRPRWPSALRGNQPRPADDSQAGSLRRAVLRSWRHGNRIKEQQLWLFADRTATMRANQLRLYFSAFAGILMTILRRAGLKGTTLANARFDTIHSRLIKLAGRIKLSVRRVWFSFSSVYPLQELFARRSRPCAPSPCASPRCGPRPDRPPAAPTAKLTAAGPALMRCAQTPGSQRA